MKSGVRGIFFFLLFFFQFLEFCMTSNYWQRPSHLLSKTGAAVYSNGDYMCLEMARIEPYLHISHIFQSSNWYLLTDFFEFPSTFYRFNEQNRRFAFDPRKSEFINLGSSVECAAFESWKFIKLPRGVQRPILLAKRTLSSLYRGLEVKSDTDKCPLVIHAAV